MNDRVQEITEQQKQFWNSESAERWVKNNKSMDRLLAPLTEILFAIADVKVGEAVLDLGCGVGSTTERAGQATGSSGKVLGLDISAPMLKAAQEKSEAEHVSFLEADASSHDFSATSFDLAMSRFGIMFFADPVAAFSNIRGALKPDGRIAMACWGPRSDNPWFQLPMDVVAEFCGPQPKIPARAPGPTAFGETDYVESILNGAGFRNIDIESREIWLDAGDDIDQTARYVMFMGPASRALAQYKPEQDVLDQMVADAKQRLQPYQTARGMEVSGLVHYLTAVAG